MRKRDTHVQKFRDLTWFIELLNHGFDQVAKVRGYTDDQFRNLEDALNQLEPVPEELDDLLVNYKLPTRKSCLANQIFGLVGMEIDGLTPYLLTMWHCKTRHPPLPQTELNAIF